MLTKVKTRAWKKVVVIGISLSLSGFIPFMTQGYAFADENPESVDIIYSDVYQNESGETQLMENESSDGLEKINFEDTNREKKTKNDEILSSESDEQVVDEDAASDTSDELDEVTDEIESEPETVEETSEEDLADEAISEEDIINEDILDEETESDSEATDEIDRTPSQEDDEEFLLPEEDTDEDIVDTDINQDIDIESEDIEDIDTESVVEEDIDTESEVIEPVTEETEPEDTDVTDSDDDAYIMDTNTTDELSEEPSEDEDADFVIPEDEDEDFMMAAEEGDAAEEDFEAAEAESDEADVESAEDAVDETESYITSDEEFDISTMDTTEDMQADPVITEEPSIEELFPESYQPLLNDLLETHPEWKMEASNTGIDWETALDAEDEGSTNLISPSAPKAQKEKSNRKYDGRWDLANRDTIAYYMDPRNFLNEDGIYQFLDQSYDANSQNVDTVAAVIEDSFMENGDPEGGYDSFAACIDDVGAETDVNPNVLAAMIIEEQGWKGSSLSSGKKEGYEGYYNYMNVGAWTTDDMSSSERGLWYAKGEGKNKKSYERPWDSPAKAIKGGAEVYSENYIENNQDTYYTKKFNVMNGEESVGTHQYMTNVQAAADEGSLVKRAYEKSKELPAIFKIPVFENMPEEICALPGK